jgi:DNA-binding transcriptional LysR family regulator
LTVRPAASRMRGLVFERLAAYPLRCAVPITHPLARKRSVKLSDLERERFIVYSREDYPEYFDELKTLFRPFGFEPRVGEEYDGATGLIAAVEAGQGIAIVTSSLACLAGQRLKLLELQPAKASIYMGALMPKENSKFVEGFVAAARLAAKDV